MAPQWDTNTRGQNRQGSDSYYDEGDYDGLSDMEIGWHIGPLIEDWEDLSVLTQ